MYKKLLIPYCYTLNTRYISKNSKITYILSNIVPVFLYILLVLKGESSIKTLIGGLIALISYITIYEIGYIFNDSFSIQNEEKPTLRLHSEEIIYIKKNIKKIVILKMLISIGLYSLLIFIYENLNVLNYVIFVTLTLLTYYIHNKFRSNKVTYITFFCLSTLRFFSPISFFLNSNNILVYLISVIFTNSLIRNFEEIGHKKYYIGNLNIYKIRHKFRVIYYLILILLIKFFKIQIINIDIIYYMIFYRSLLVIAMYKKIKEEKDNGRNFISNL